MAEIAMRVEGLTHRFYRGTPSEIVAMEGISLELESGTFAVVLGANGSGKSSLLNAIAGSLKPTAGRVMVDEQDITDWPERRRAGLIGRVFQNPHHGTSSELTVAENLLLAGRRGATRWFTRGALDGRLRAIRERVAGLRMGLEDRLDVPMGRLSGGQRQALTVLMASLVRPSLLLLDEHTAALDSVSAVRVLELTREFIVAQGLTALMVTHSVAQAVQLGHRILVIHRGRITHDFRVNEGLRVTQDDLLQVFDQLRWSDQLDQSAADMLRRQYV